MALSSPLSGRTTHAAVSPGCEFPQGGARPSTGGPAARTMRCDASPRGRRRTEDGGPDQAGPRGRAPRGGRRPRRRVGPRPRGGRAVRRRSSWTAACPDIDGITVMRLLRAKGIATPVLLLTALGSVDDRVAGLDAGADDYLAKPFAFSELLARIRALGRRPAPAGGEPDGGRRPRPRRAAPRRPGRRTDRGPVGPRVRAARATSSVMRARSSRGSRSWTRSGARSRTSTPTSWTCTCPTCAGSWASWTARIA